MELKKLSYQDPCNLLNNTNSVMTDAFASSELPDYDVTNTFWRVLYEIF